MRTVDLDLLVHFAAVDEAGTFSGAARSLGLPKSSVSRAIARLEDQLRTSLFHRTTRHVALTTAGAEFRERTVPLLKALQEAVVSLPEQDEQPAGTLRVTASVDVGALVLGDVLPAFAARYPQVRVDAYLTNRKVDLVREGFDLALRAAVGRQADSSLVQRKLSPIEMLFYAAPGYLNRAGTPRTLAELGRHDLVWFRASRGNKRLGLDPARARITGDDFFFIRKALRNGAGVGLLPSFMAEEDLRRGELSCVLPRHREHAGSLVLLQPRTQNTPRKVTAFRDFLVETLARRPLA